MEIALDKILCLVGANNSGKSTVLRAYELAVSNQPLPSELRYAGEGAGCPAVEIWVHIPPGTPNVDDKWKEPSGDLRIVRSKWSWSGQGVPVRQTWNPNSQKYSTDEKASGLDQVFASRLPKPFRIGALQNPKQEYDELLKLVIEPLAAAIEQKLLDPESSLSQSLSALVAAAKAEIAELESEAKGVESHVAESLKEVFRDLDVKLHVDVQQPQFKPLDSLTKGTHFKITDGTATTNWAQQGSGSQRALFWALLQARSRLKAQLDEKLAKKKAEAELAKELKKLEKKKSDLKKEDAIARVAQEIAQLTTQTDQTSDPGVGLPGHMLLIDEPETCLHPNAIRAARSHLYSLAKDSNWQVMLCTHSPLFIDPLEDHTTIVRMERGLNGDVPRTYRSENIAFSEDEKANLKLLLRFDTSLAEMFFGSYPIVVEGDTEYGAFEELMRLEGMPQAQRPIILRARGKDMIVSLAKILAHFKVNFSVLHDGDAPRTRSGKRSNSAWTSNDRIVAALNESRSKGARVIHRISIPDFERARGLGEGDDDKPWEMWSAIRADPRVRASVKSIFDELCIQSSPEVLHDNVLARLRSDTESWAKANAPGDKAFEFEAAKKSA